MIHVFLGLVYLSNKTVRYHNIYNLYQFCFYSNEKNDIKQKQQKRIEVKPKEQSR